MGIESLPPQVRISPDGRWLAWRSPAATEKTWSVRALDGDDSEAYLTDRAVMNWHALVAAAPLLSAWNEEITGCVGDRSVEACPECRGLSLAVATMERAAGL